MNNSKDVFDLIDDHCPVLTVENISAGYVGARQAIENVTFDVLPGERLVIIGPNGAGKSTLFKTLIGLIPHQTGHISLHGEDCRTSHKMFGYVPQHEEIDWRFPVTVYDVVMMGRTRKIGWFRWPSKSDRERVRAALQQVGMAEFASRQIGQLSGGQRRRVFIARALVQETDILLLDEPFSGLDVAAEQEILLTLDRLQEGGITVLLATHDMNLAASHFDRLLLLNRHVVAFGPANDVFQIDALKQAYGGRVGVFEQNGQKILVTDEHGWAE